MDNISKATIDYFILSDRAEAVSGKLYVMGGGWDRLTHPDFKVAIPLSVAVGIMVPPGAFDLEQYLNFSFETAEHKPVLGSPLITAGFTTNPPAQFPDDPNRVVFALPLIPIIFPGPGVYYAVVKLNDTEIRSARFRLIEGVPTGQGTP